MNQKYFAGRGCLFALLAAGLVLSACKKELNAKPSQALETPSSLKDLQALLDNPTYMNNEGPSFDEASADNYFLSPSAFAARADFQRNAYLWQSKGSDFADFPNDWAFIYNCVYYANVVLDNIGNIALTADNQSAWNNVRGSALFFRSLSFLRAAWIYATTYDSATASGEPGIVLRLSSDFNLPSSRATLKDSYEKIINDLKEAIPLLPASPKQVSRPSRTSAFALLARTYLSMRNYPAAGLYADSCLQLNSTLIDYNTLNTNASLPFQRYNSEVLFQSKIGSFSFSNVNPRTALVDTALYTSYADGDLRKTTFFKLYAVPNQYNFKGNYDASLSTQFVGIATDEVYLMRAECYAREGNISAAMTDLNTLMISRWNNTDVYVPFEAATSDEALNLILTERRKELIFRGLRWMDLKRLNKERSNITLTRIMDNITYTLPPNDSRYALPLPDPIIEMTGMPQNPQ